MSGFKRWDVIAGLLIIIGLLAACAAPAAPTQVATPGGERAADQTLRVVWEGGMGNGPVPGLDIGSSAFPIQTYRPCLMFDKEQNLLPDSLCERYEANEDGTVFTFHINPNAVWSDGKKITAQDFVDWYTFIFDAARGTWTRDFVFGPVLGMDEFGRGEADSIAGIEAIDDVTLQITLWRSEGWFPLRMSWRWSAPARVDQYAPLLERAAEFETPQDWWAAISDIWMKENAANLIVSGPFKYVYMEPEPAAIYKLEQNPNWWGSEKPTLAAIEGTTIRDFQTMLLMFENGEIDIALALSGPPAVLLRNSRPEVFRESPSSSYTAMFIDTQKPPTDDINLRKALMHAIDWEQVAEVAWEGQFPAMNGGTIFTPNLPCYDADYAPYPFDVDLAKEHLAASIYGPDGASVPKIRILTAGSDPPRIRAAQIIQEMWRVNLGIEDVEIKNAEAEFADGAGLVNLYVSSGGAAVPIPALALEELAHSRGHVAQEWTHFSTPELDETIDGLLSMDPNAVDYCAAVQETLDEVMDQALVIPTAWWLSFYQVQPWLQGYDQGLLSEWIGGWVTDTSTWIAEH